ncbi:hypothetical protein B0A48_08356 [Cryoendolithus antarcticus]|uniref:Uncharacterized protein n=1 Tax=Cryoendolithus antarcticus TaxID=1507870 RepID=A0A1V8T579_9PEZI|nr:hypothetical protein B0A48_08356 [Cryoendolithus antarcticus]
MKHITAALLCSLLMASSTFATPPTKLSALTSGTELRLEPESILHVGADGVLRSVNAKHTAVLDYIRLSPA